MELLGEVNGRQILYISVMQTVSWLEELPIDSWLVTPIGHQGDIDRIYHVAERCLQRNVVYVCALGQESSAIHDAFDLAIVNREIQDGNGPNSLNGFNESPMTTMHENMDEGFWFATTLAYRPGAKINKIVCLDLTKQGEKSKLVDLITKINSGWLPGVE